MKHSESISSIAPALVKAQAAIEAAVKDKTNPHFRSKYADLTAVIDAVKEPLNKEGIAFLQGFEECADGVRVETMLLHTSGEWISTSVSIPVIKLDAQGTGSAITYGKRYGLQALCGVPSEDDDGNAAAASQNGARQVAKQVERANVKPTAGSEERLTPERMSQIADSAMSAQDAWKVGDKRTSYVCYMEARAKCKDADEAVYLRTLFPSDARTYFKKTYDEEQLATQA